jgi:hypothetical protein
MSPEAQATAHARAEELLARDDIFAPYYPTDPLLIPAWLGLLHYALGQPEMVAQFRQDTGHQWHPGSTPLDRLVDEATGAERAFLEAFAAWVNATLW